MALFPQDEMKAVSTDLLHSFSLKDGMSFGDLESQELKSGRVYYKVSVWFQSKDQAVKMYNKAGGDAVT